MRLPRPFRKKVTEAKEVARWAAWAQETSYRGKRKAFGDRFRPLAWGKVLLSPVPLVASLLGIFRA